MIDAAGFGVVLSTVGVVALALWVWSVRLRDASIVDLFWGPAFVLAGATAMAWSQRTTPPGLLALGLVSAWALRLAVHLGRRNLGAGEDRRYRAMRDAHGARFWWVSLFTVFLLQALLVAIVSLPLQALVGSSRGALGVFEVAGAAIFLAGLMVEAVADAQLRRFVRDPSNRGKVLDTGLWRYSRHPNYFGDAVVWWGLGVMATPHGAFFAWIGPLVMTTLLLRVSGVTLLEKTIGERRPGYADYVRRTSAFVPWPPRRV